MMVCNEYVGGLMGNSIECLVEVDVGADGIAWGEYMRLRVSIVVTKPLLRRKRFMIDDLLLVWIRFSYDCLPDYCYGYGIIGHNHKNCMV